MNKTEIMRILEETENRYIDEFNEYFEYKMYENAKQMIIKANAISEVIDLIKELDQ